MMSVVVLWIGRQTLGVVPGSHAAAAVEIDEERAGYEGC